MTIWLIIIGIAFGVIGGMGMGGGIILIPALTLLLNFNQHSAQALNLAIFFPMAIAALILHFKNHHIKVKSAVKLIIGGIAGASIGAYIAILLDEAMLKIIFGVFLVLVAIYRVYALEIKPKSKRNISNKDSPNQ